MIIQADARALPLPDQSVQCCVTSPPYWGLRDYGVTGQIGLEQTPDAYVAELVAVFREVRRVLKDDGVLWLNLGDSYSNGGRSSRDSDGKLPQRAMSSRPDDGLKPKDLVGIPWRVAFALQAGGWYLRSDCIWHKPNPMPESVTDRPTKAHEYVFLLSKAERYYYDAKAIQETSIHAGKVVSNAGGKNAQMGSFGATRGGFMKDGGVTVAATRNARTVWTIATQPYKGAHFATFPRALAERCILAGSRPGDTVLDPFSGSGTTVEVALKHGRKGVGIELNPDYIALAEARIKPFALLA